MLLASFACMPLIVGCHSAFVQATVINQTGHTIRNFEVDYPTASFGSSDLASGAKYHYRFKILGSGAAQFLWTDNLGHDHTSSGPALDEGQEGSLRIVVTPNAAEWTSQLRKAK